MRFKHLVRWFDVLVIWRSGDLTSWWFDVLVIWRFGDLTLRWSDVLMIRRSDDPTFWWIDVLVIWRSDDLTFWWRESWKPLALTEWGWCKVTPCDTSRVCFTALSCRYRNIWLPIDLITFRPDYLSTWLRMDYLSILLPTLTTAGIWLPIYLITDATTTGI